MALGTRRGEVEHFLLGALQSNSEKSYLDALKSFRIECNAQGIQFQQLGPEEQDWILAEHILALHDRDPNLRTKAVYLVAAITKINPTRRFKTAQRVLLRWGTEMPKREAPPMPKDLLLAIVVWLHVHERPVVSTVILICFSGLLRVSEVLDLVRRNIVMCETAAILILDRTKRGQNEKVVLTNTSVIKWLRAYMLNFPCENHERAFQVSYSTVGKWLSRAANSLGFKDLAFTTHSLRRGGAT